MLLSATSKVKFVDKREYAQHQVVLNRIFTAIPIFEPFKIICLGPFGHLNSAPEFWPPQLIRDTNHCLEKLGPTQSFMLIKSLFISLITIPEILLIYLHQILRLGFLVGQPSVCGKEIYRDRVDSLLCYWVTKVVPLLGSPVFHVYSPQKSCA